MFILIPLIAAAVFGYAVAYSVKSDHSIAQNMIVAAIGAVIIRILTYFVSLGVNSQTKNDFMIALISSVLGAILFTYIYNVGPSIYVDDEDKTKKA